MADGPPDTTSPLSLRAARRALRLSAAALATILPATLAAFAPVIFGASVAAAQAAPQAGVAPSSAALCQAPSVACGQTLQTACLDFLGVGAISAAPSSCGDQLTAYRSCLIRAVQECGGAAADEAWDMALAMDMAAEPQGGRADASAREAGAASQEDDVEAAGLDLDALYAARAITITLSAPPRPPGLSRAEIANTFRCRKNPDCAALFFHAHHDGALIFDIDQSDRRAGELRGWLPQSASAAQRRRGFWKGYSGHGVVSGEAVVITGRVFTDGRLPHCAINLAAIGPRRLSGAVTCSNMRPFAAAAEIAPS